MSFLRPYLMGDAYVAVADEASVVFYNPAAIRSLGGVSVELFAPQITGDEDVKLAVLDSEALQQKYAGVDQKSFRSLLGESLFFNLNLRLPAIVAPEAGIAYGLGGEVLGNIEILQNPVLPGIRLEFYSDQVLFFSKAYQWTENLHFGLTTKLIRRYGVDAIFTVGELFAAGAGADLSNHPAFQDAAAGNTHSSVGLDLGWMYYFPYARDWRPRMGVSVLNIGPNGSHPQGGLAGMEFGKRPSPFSPPVAGELSQINTIGFAVSPIVNFIRYTMAVDYVDFTRTALSGDSHNRRLRLGFEMGIGPRDDGTAIMSILAGLNANHPSFGIISRVTVFEIGMGYYELERGPSPGDQPDKRYVIIFGFRI